MKLLRNLRRRLVAEGRLKNYLAYAFGEIVLVVVGILIALQINSWNTDRLRRQVERAHLEELRADLDADLASITRVEQFNAAKRAAIQELGAFLMRPRDPAAMGEMGRLMGAVGSFELPPITRVAFDNLMSSEGIGLISDRELRRGLTSYYSYLGFDHGTAERLRELTRGFVDATNAHISREEVRRMVGVESGMPALADIDYSRDPQIWGRLFMLVIATDSQGDDLVEQRQRCRALVERIDKVLGG